MVEIWKDVLGYAGVYKISNMGRCKSVDHVDARNHNRKGRYYEGVRTERGHYSFSFHRFGKQKTFLGSVIVYNTFVGAIDNKYALIHIDGDRKNNSLSNLKVVRISEISQSSPCNKNKSSSIFKGVHCYKGKYRARCSNKGIRVFLGDFDDEILAAKVYDDYVLTHIGGLADTNKSLGML